MYLAIGRKTDRDYAVQLDFMKLLGQMSDLISPFTMTTLFLCALLCLSLAHTTAAQAEQPNDHAHSNHQHGDFEFGLSLQYIYLDEDEDHEEDEHQGEDEHDHQSHDDESSAFGLDVHLLRRLPEEGLTRFFAVGVGAEVIFTDDPHFSLLGAVGVYPWKELELIISPGVEFAKHDGEREREFVMHYEITYGFLFNSIHIGPVLGFAHTRESRHYSAGIHFGF